MSLQCARCRWSSELPLCDTQTSTVLPCVHCGAAIYWHRCPRCELCYLGAETPACPSCEDVSLDELEFD